MSLADAIPLIIQCVEEEAAAAEKGKEQWHYHSVARLLRSYARELRTAVKAAEASPAESLRRNAVSLSSSLSDSVGESVKRKLDREDGVGFHMAEIVGGPVAGEEPTMTVVDPAMPVGAKTLFADSVYVLQPDGRLLFSEEETAKYRRQKEGG